MNDHKIIVAVSGGVDSVVLLHRLVSGTLRGFEGVSSEQIIVAHVDHGIRSNSADDAKFVESLCREYGVLFETIQLGLGPEASEELARKERYKFLDSLARKYKTESILIAHHADDLIETAAINLTRGSGRRGLSSIRSRSGRIRPMLEETKQQILEYANQNNLKWVEDQTNTDHKYLRNRIRHNIKDKKSTDEYAKFATELQKVHLINDQLDLQLSQILSYRFTKKAVISRSWFVKLPHTLACEVMHAALTKLKVKNIDRQLVEKLVISLKAGKPGSKVDVDKTTYTMLTKRSMRFVHRATHKTHHV